MDSYNWVSFLARNYKHKALGLCYRLPLNSVHLSHATEKVEETLTKAEFAVRQKAKLATPAEKHLETKQEENCQDEDELQDDQEVCVLSDEEKESEEPAAKRPKARSAKQEEARQKREAARNAKAAEKVAKRDVAKRTQLASTTGPPLLSYLKALTAGLDDGAKLEKKTPEAFLAEQDEDGTERTSTLVRMRAELETVRAWYAATSSLLAKVAAGKKDVGVLPFDAADWCTKNSNLKGLLKRFKEQKALAKPAAAKAPKRS